MTPSRPRAYSDMIVGKIGIGSDWEQGSVLRAEAQGRKGSVNRVPAAMAAEVTLRRSAALDGLDGALGEDTHFGVFRCEELPER